MRLSAPIHRLKRTARDLADADAIPLHAALDQVAAREGYSSWSLLTARQQASDAPTRLYKSLRPGSLVLVAARPLQGKTVLALRLALCAIADGTEAHFFSLDYSESDVVARLSAMPAHLLRFANRLHIDCSDAIAADHIMGRLSSTPHGAFVAIDYLQLLDQKRTNPPLQQQVEALRAFARAHGHVLAFVCQIDRAFDPAASDMPGLNDIRLPNPLDLRLFDRAVFLQGDRMRVTDKKS